MPAIVRLVCGRRLAGRGELLVLQALGRQRIFGQALAVLVNFEPVRVFQELDVLSFGARHPVIITVESGKAVFIGAATMVAIRGGQVRRQLQKVGALMLEGFGGD